MTLGDRIVIMKEGYIQQVGTPQEVFIHPANLFVAGFIGTPQMNFFDAELVRQGDRYHVSLAGATVTLSPEKCRRLADGGVESGPVTLGVRPEHMVLTTADNAIFASVDVSEMMGSAIHIHVDACGRDVVIVVPVSEEELETRERALVMGTPVRFTFRGSAAHLFDRETGVNLEWKAAPEPPAPPEPETPVQDPPPLGDPLRRERGGPCFITANCQKSPPGRSPGTFSLLCIFLIDGVDTDGLGVGPLADEEEEDEVGGGGDGPADRVGEVEHLRRAVQLEDGGHPQQPQGAGATRDTIMGTTE